MIIDLPLHTGPLLLAAALLLRTCIVFRNPKAARDWISTGVFCTLLMQPPFRFYYIDLPGKIVEITDAGLQIAASEISATATTFRYPSSELALIASWILPFLLAWLPGFLVKYFPRLHWRKIGSVALVPTISLFSLMVFWGFFGWMSEERAILTARYHLHHEGETVKGPEIAERRWNRWVIHYPEAEFKRIALTRNGDLDWTYEP